jgi:hypothetical protein
VTPQKTFSGHSPRDGEIAFRRANEGSEASISRSGPSSK